MKRLALPKYGDEITAQWMQRALTAGGASGFRAIEDVKVEKMSSVTSALGALFRCHLSTEGDTPANPASVVAKFPTTNPVTARLVSLLSAYRREYVFYRDIAPHKYVRVPHLFYGDYAKRTHRSILIIEDLGDMRAIPQVEGVGEARALLAIREIAALHGQFREAKQVPELADIGPFLSPTQSRIMQTIYLLTLPRALQRFPDCFKARLRRNAEIFGTRIDSHFAAVSEGSTTFIHGDYRADNVLFGHDDMDDIAIIDWQACGIGSGMFDVAFFLATSVSIDERRRLERDAVDEYLGIVHPMGASSLTREACWRSYRQNMLGTLMYMVIGAGGMSMSDAQFVGQTRELLSRTLTAIEDLDAWEFIPNQGGYFSSLSRYAYKAYGLFTGKRR